MKRYIEKRINWLDSIGWLVLKKVQLLTIRNKILFLLTTMCWVSIEIISKDRQKIYLPPLGIKVVQAQTFRTIFNGLESIAVIAFLLVGRDLWLIIFKTIDSDDIRCPILNALVFNLDATVRLKWITTFMPNTLIWLVRYPKSS